MDDTAVRVSVIMPAYNAAGTIGRAVTSALRQTEPHLEVIIIDDASTDATVAITERLAMQDGRVRVLRQPINRGPAAARNRGLDCARGEWVALLDADDEFVPHRVARLMALADDRGADIVADNLLLCQDTGRRPETAMISRAVLPEARWMSAAEFVAGNIGSRYTPRVSFGFMQPLIRRSFLEMNGLRYEEQNRFGEDFLLSLSCLLAGARWWITPEPLYRYTVRFGTATDVQSAADLLRIRTIEQTLLSSHPMVAADPKLAVALRRHKQVIEHFYYYRAFTDALKARKIRPALGLLLQSPGSFRHILTEGALQAPRVTMKALRGGYRGRRARIPAVNGAGATRRAGRQT
jgi:glycosyltransferase involved in cell wall biosynthesis